MNYNKYLIITLFFAFSLISFGQTDSDFDGIPDDKDEKPFVTDVPKLLILSENVSFGIDYEITGNSTLTGKKTLTISNSDVFSRTVTTRSNFTNELIRKTSENLTNSLQLSFGSELTYASSLAMSASNSRSETNTFTYSNEISTSSVNSYKREVTEFLEWNSNTNVSFKENSGFIDSGLRIRNLGLTSVSFKNLQVKLVEFDPNSGTDINTIEVINLGDFEIHPSDEDIQYFAIPIRLRGQSTNKILNIINNRHIVKVYLQQYILSYNGIDFVPSILNRRLAENTIKLNILDQFGNYNEYHISMLANPERKLSLKDALSQVSSELVEVVTENVDARLVNHLLKFNGKVSDFSTWGKPEKYSEKELDQSSWVVIPHNINLLQTDFFTPLPPSSEYSIIYLSKRKIWEKFRKVENLLQNNYGDLEMGEGYFYWDLPYPFPKNKKEGNANGKIVDNFEALNRKFREFGISGGNWVVTKGDIVSLKIRLKRAVLVEEDIPISFRPSCRGNCSGMFTARGILRKLKISSFEDIVSQNLEDYDLIRFGFPSLEKPLKLSEIAAMGIANYRLLPDGNLLFNFSIPPEILDGVDHSSFLLYLIAPTEKRTFGRSVTAYPDRGGSQVVGKFENRDIRTPFTVGIKLDISHPPSTLENQIDEKQLKFMKKNMRLPL